MTGFVGNLLDHERFLGRALQLAALGGGAVSPNPLVGAVIVSADGRILGEGYHPHDGGPHAEVQAFRNVAPRDESLLRQATIYVSLEPCSIHGRTPPCADLIVRKGVPRAVVGCIDFTPGVCGRGLQRLREAGVAVRLGVLQAKAFQAARFRHATVRNARPYVILKQALSADGSVGRRGARVPITGPLANRISHAWRARVDAIAVGAGTVVADDPSLTTRLSPGSSPHRVVIDLRGDLELDRARLAGAGEGLLHFEPDASRVPWVEQLLALLQERRVGKLLVEGGPRTLAAFVEAGAWDEYREWRSPTPLPAGVREPVAGYSVGGHLVSEDRYGDDALRVFSRLDVR